MRSTDLQDLLRARIAELEDTAGQLKDLAELKQGIAEDVEVPPEDPERFQQKASEDKRDAIAGLTAANTLKVVLDQRTKATQIAMLRHYVLDFDKAMNRSAKLSSSLADGDPRKKDADDDGFTASFVITILNGIISEVASEPARIGVAMKVRTIDIWVTGLLASGLIGFAIGAHFQRPDAPSSGALWGMLAALGIFTCARFWLDSGRS